MEEAYYPWESLIHLRDARFDPAAAPSLELLSGAFFWPDEGWLEFVAACRDRGNTRYHEPAVYRSSLIKGQPREDCRRGWEWLRQHVSQWPGFRPERSSESLRAELERQLAEDW
jgi:hypothetical protein